MPIHKPKKKANSNAAARQPKRKTNCFERQGASAFPLLLVLASGLLFGCGGYASPSNQTTSKTLWSAGMETGDLSEWYYPATGPAGNNGGAPELSGGSGNALASAATDFAHTGKYSAKLTISAPPESGARLFRWLEPQTYADLYYRVWYYFPETYTPNGSPAFWNVLQWKSKGATEGNNAIYVLNVGEVAVGGQPTMFFYLCRPSSPTSGTTDCGSQPSSSPAYIAVGKWTEVEAHYVCAADSTGHVTIWQDGIQLFDLAGPTRYSDGDCEWSVNNYSNSLNPTPATIYIDDAAICSSARCP